MPIRLIESLADLELLAGAWNSLPGSSDNPLVSHDWFCAAAGTLHREQRLQVVTVWRGRDLVAAAPLVEARRGLWSRLEFLGTAALYEPCDVLSHDQEALAELAQYLVGLRRPMSFQRVRAGLELATALRSTGTGQLVPVVSAPSNRVDLQESWPDYLAKRSRECRLGFPRKWKQLAAGGDLSFESLTPGPDDTDSLLVEFKRVEAASWKSAAESDVGSRPNMEAFFHELSRRFATRRQIRVCFLRRDGEAVAAALGLEYGSRLWELKVGYDERYRASSPGRLLLWHMLRDAFTRNLDAYEFLGAGDGQQAAWKTSEQRLETLVYYPYSIRGAAAVTIDASRSLIRRATSAMSRP